MSKIIGVTVGTTAPRPNWTEENERNAAYIKNKPIIDSTLTIDGAIADAKATGDAINQMQASIDEVASGKADSEHIHAIEDITDLQAELESKYEKPSDGIPATDLTAGVQESLDKANTAIQSLDGYATEGYVSDAIVAHNASEAAHNDIYYTKTEIDSLELITIEDIDTICGVTV